MGLPRSNLVKKNAIPAPASAPPAGTANPFEATVPHGLSPFDIAPASAAENPFRTQVDSIECSVDLDQTSRDAPMATTAPMAAPILVAPPAMTNTMGTQSTVIEPSTAALLERAARLGPARMTWESIVLPSDPILGEKMQPRVAERRARFRKIVTVALGGCLALCVAAIGVSLISGGSSSDTSATASASIGRTTPATAFVPVEKLDITKHGRAHVHAAALAAPAPKAKRH